MTNCVAAIKFSPSKGIIFSSGSFSESLAALVSPDESVPPAESVSPAALGSL